MIALILSNVAPAAADPTITWTPAALTESLKANESKTITVSFTPSEDIRSAVVRVVPQLQPFVQPDPSSFSRLRKGRATKLKLTFSAPANLPLTTIQGTVQLRDGSAATAKEFATPLPITLVVDTLPPHVTIASPAHLSTVNRSPITVSGTVSEDGVAVTVNGVAATVTGQTYMASVPLQEGTNTITAMAQDTLGNVGTASIQVTLDTTPPVLTLVAPAQAPPGGTVIVSVDAADATGIAAVILFLQGVLLATATSPPFEFVFAMPINVAAGSQLELAVEAQDGAGHIMRATHMLRVATGRDTFPPTVGLTAPATATPGSDVTLTAAAEDDSQVAQLTLAQNGHVLHQVTAPPFTVQHMFTIPANAKSGDTFSFTAMAADTSNNVGAATATIQVVSTPDTTPPTVVIKAPFQALPGSVILVGATARDEGPVASGIAAVVFSDGGSFAVTDVIAPYEVEYFIPPTATLGSIITFTATARDFAGLVATASIQITIVDITPPSVIITAPARASPGSTVPVTASARDNVDVTLLTLSDGTRTLTNRDVPFEIQHTFTIPSNAMPGMEFTFTATALDAAGNVGTATATVQVTTIPDTAPPTVTLHAPSQTAPGSTLRLAAEAADNVGVASVTFSTASGPIATDLQPPYEATFVVPADTAIGSTLTMTATASDYAGLTASDAKTVSVVATPDTTSPSVDVRVRREALPGETITVTAIAQDDVGVSSVTFFANGLPIFTDVSEPFATTFTIPQDAALGSLIALKVEAIDFSGNRSTATVTIRVVSRPPAVGRGVIVGQAYDDRTGRFVRGAAVTMGGANAPVVETDDRGHYALEAEAGPVHIRIAKAGFTTVDRSAQVEPGFSTALFDARLTPFDAKANPISGAFGGTATSADGSISVVFPPGAFGEDREFRLTVVSGQGLQGHLPPGWSPLVTVDLNPGDLTFTDPVTLLLPNHTGLPAGAQVVAAIWEEALQRWMAIPPAHITPAATHIQVELTRSGQVALLLPDAAPMPPAVPVLGEALTGVNPTPLAQATAEVLPEPRILFTQPEARSEVTTQVTAASAVPSGTPVQARISEQFSLLSGNQLITKPYTQDLMLYHVHEVGSPPTLVAQFPVTPSRSFSPTEFEHGVIDIAINLPPAMGLLTGAVVGPGGGMVLGPSGERLVIPLGALSESTAVQMGRLSPQDVVVSIPTGFSFVDAIALDFGRASLDRPAQLSLPLPAGVTAVDQVVVVQLVEAMDATRLAFVGRAVVMGNTLVADVTSASTPGVRDEGRYLFLKAASPLGFVTGVVFDLGGEPESEAVVRVDTLPFIARTNALGVYTVPTLVGPFEVTAVDLTAGDEGRARGAVASPGEVATVDIQLVLTRPTVKSVSPGDRAVGVPLTTAVHVTFSEPIDPATLIGTSTFTLTSGAGAVAGTITLSAGNTVATFTPRAALASETLFTVALTTGIRDRGGRPLEPFTSTFTTLDVTPPPLPPAGQIAVRLPENGIARVTGTQGTVEPGSLIIVTNAATGTTATAAANADGSFAVNIPLSLGEKVLITVQDQAGNRTNLDGVPFVDANGEPVTIIGSAGGVVTGPGGVRVEIPAGAVPDGTIVKIKPIAEVDYPVPPPTGFLFLGAVHLDIGNVTASKELKVSIPAPSGVPADKQILVVQPIDVAGALKLHPINLAVLDGDRITTASPPYPGVRNTAEIAFLLSQELVLQTASIVASVFPGALGMFIGAFPDFAYPFGSGSITAVVPANQPLLINFTDTSGQVVQSVARPPIPPGPPVVVPADQPNGVAPAVVRTTPFNGTTVNIDATGTLTFSEPMAAMTIESNFKLLDANGRQVKGQMVFENSNQKLTFVTDRRLKYATTYRYELNGAQDASGEALPNFTSSFKTFEPRIIGSLPMESANSLDYLDTTITVVVANGARFGGDLGDLTGLVLVNVTDPTRPIQIGSEIVTTGADLGVVALKDSFAGNVAIAVSGSIRSYGSLRIYDLNDPVATANHEDGTFLGGRLLSTPPGLNPLQGVPSQSGIPMALAVGGDQVAYVATVPLGIQAVGIQQSIPIQRPQPPIEGFFAGNFSDVDVSGGKVLAAGRLSSGGFGLTVLNTDLTNPREVLTPGSGSRVKGLANFFFDVNGDGQQDANEIFNLAFVGDGSAGLQIIDVSPRRTPAIVATIPTAPMPALDITIDAKTNLAYVGACESGVMIIDISNPFEQARETCGGQPCVDKDGDGQDDRILGVVDTPGCARKSALDPERGLLYVADGTAGLQIMQLQPPRIEVLRVNPLSSREEKTDVVPLFFPADGIGQGPQPIFYFDDTIDLTLQFSQAITDSVVDSVSATISTPTGFVEVDLKETAANSREFVDSGNGFSLRIVALSGMDPLQPDTMEVQFSSSTLGIPPREVSLFETSFNSLRFLSLQFQVEVHFLGAPTATNLDRILVVLQNNLVPSSELSVLEETTPNSLVFADVSQSLIVRIPALPAFDPTTVDGLEVVISDSLLGFSGRTFRLMETGVSSGSFANFGLGLPTDLPPKEIGSDIPFKLRVVDFDSDTTSISVQLQTRVETKSITLDQVAPHIYLSGPIVASEVPVNVPAGFETIRVASDFEFEYINIRRVLTFRKLIGTRKPVFLGTGGATPGVDGLKHLQTISAILQRMGYGENEITLEANLHKFSGVIGKDLFKDILPKHSLLYTFTHGIRDRVKGAFLGPSIRDGFAFEIENQIRRLVQEKFPWLEISRQLEKQILFAQELPDGLQYQLVYLNSCNSGNPGPGPNLPSENDPNNTRDFILKFGVQDAAYIGNIGRVLLVCMAENAERFFEKLTDRDPKTGFSKLTVGEAFDKALQETKKTCRRPFDAAIYGKPGQLRQ